MIATIREAVGEARMENDRIQFVLNWLHLFVKRYGIPTKETNEWAEMRPQIWPICLPMSTSRQEGERMMFGYQITHRIEP